MVTHHVAFALVPTSQVFAHRLALFPIPTFAAFALVQSSVHEPWAREYSSSLETRINYSPSDCFETFPFPIDLSGLETVGERYHEHRRQLMQARGEGLTKTYNRFHDPGETAADIAELRALHRQLDTAVAAAYGWRDLAAHEGTALGHAFHETKQGTRHTLAPTVRREVLDRLLALNHQRYAEEVKAGLHDIGAKKPKKPKVAPTTAAQKSAAGGVQFGLALALPASAERTLPMEFRLPASDGAHYTVSLVFALLSEAGGSLPLTRLRDAFVLATSPKLMQRLAPCDDAARAKAWAQRWSEDAKPAMLLDSLKAIGARHLTVSPGAEGRIFQLLDGPRPPANEDVGYDAWLALRVASTLAPSAVLLPECAAWTKQAEELVLA